MEGVYAHLHRYVNAQEAGHETVLETRRRLFRQFDAPATMVADRRIVCTPQQIFEAPLQGYRLMAIWAFPVLHFGLLLQFVLAEASAGVVQDVIGDDGCRSGQVDDAIGDIVEGDEAGSACCFHLLTNQCEVGLEVKFVGTDEHRVAAGGLTALGIDILACEGLGEAVTVHATDFLAMVDEGETVGIVQVDEHILAVLTLQIAEGGVCTKRRDVLHVAEQLLVFACHGEGIEWVLGTSESGMSQGNGTKRPRLTRGLVVIEGDAVTEVPVECRDKQGAIGTDGVEDGFEELVTIETLTVTHTGKSELHNVGREQHAVAFLQSPVLGEVEITNVRHTSSGGLRCCRRSRSSQERRPCRRCGS